MKLYFYPIAVIFAALLCTPSIAQTTNSFPPDGNVSIGAGNPTPAGPDAIVIIRNNSDGGATNSPSISLKNSNPNDPAGNGYNLAWQNLWAGNGQILGQVAVGYGTGGISPWNAGTGLYIHTRTNHPIFFGTASTEKMRITNDGKVCINTKVPRGQLSVYGDIWSTKVKVIQTGWGDYVFQNNYKLRPLSELEEYVNKYHHLPEIPSAREIEKNGLDLGDNQAKSVVKIEELTLYLIQQNKVIEQLNAKVADLEKELHELKKGK